MELIFASNNQHKLQEISAMLGNEFKLFSLNDIGCTEDIPEPWPSMEENALAKARYVYENFRKDCFADDSGLEVMALDGKPGVFSARYAGPAKNSLDNMNKLLAQMVGITQREARFRAVMALIIDGKEFLFEGTVNGKIAPQPKGDGGFGYDPVFIPDGYDQTFGELPPEIKNTMSHRFRALEKVLEFLKNR